MHLLACSHTNTHTYLFVPFVQPLVTSVLFRRLESKASRMWLLESFSFSLATVSFLSSLPRRIIGHWPVVGAWARNTLLCWGLVPTAQVGTCTVVCNLTPPGFGRTPLDSLTNLVTPGGPRKRVDLEEQQTALPLLWALAIFRKTPGEEVLAEKHGHRWKSPGLVPFVDFHPAWGETKGQILSLLNDSRRGQGFSWFLGRLDKPQSKKDFALCFCH